MHLITAKRPIFRALHICEWNKQIAIKEKFHLYKWEVDFTKEDFVIGLEERVRST